MWYIVEKELSAHSVEPVDVFYYGPMTHAQAKRLKAQLTQQQGDEHRFYVITPAFPQNVFN